MTLAFPIPEIARAVGIVERTAMRRLKRAGVKADFVSLAGVRKTQHFTIESLPRVIAVITAEPSR